jgi:4-amino-4-deoxy-L-arabinose transferase-like glycosyltransferase
MNATCVRPSMLVATFVAALAVIWTLVPAVVHLAPPPDVVESTLWSRDWPIGTYKHPALPVWMLGAAERVTGAAGWPAYLLAQLCIAVTMLGVFVLGRELTDDRTAAVAVFSLVGLEHITWRAVEFNHNIVQLPCAIAAMLIAWRAVQSGGLWRWLLLGAVAALGMYAKLSHAFVLVAIASWILSHASGRAHLMTAGPWAGAALFAALTAPLAMWVAEVDGQPLAYAYSRGLSPRATVLNFAGDTALAALPGLLMLAGAWRGARRDPGEGPVRPVVPGGIGFLSILVWAPIGFLLVSAAVMRTGVRPAWAALSLVLLPLWLLAVLRSRWPALTDVTVLKLGRVAGVLLALTVVIYGAVPLAGIGVRGQPLRINWPQRQIEREAARIWSAATPQPLRIVTGTAWPAGVVGLSHAVRPSIFTGADPLLAPWITPERLAREGTLVVWHADDLSTLTPQMSALIAGHRVHMLDLRSVPALPARAARPRLNMVVIPPKHPT